MGWTAEDAEDFVVAYLDSNFATQLNTIEAARSVTIPDFATLTKTEPGKLQVPLVMVTATEVSYDWGPDEAPMREGPVRDFSVEITCTHAIGAEVDREGLKVVLQRYEEALVDLMVTDWTFGNNAVRITAVSADFSPEGTDGETKMRYQSVLLTCLLRRHP